MNTQTTQLRVTLPIQLQAYLRAKADKFGLSLSAYVKNLILTDVQDVEVPTYPMSKNRENIALQALEEYQQGKTKEIKDVDQFLDAL